MQSVRTGCSWERLLKSVSQDLPHLPALNVERPNKLLAETCCKMKNMIQKSVWLFVIMLIFIKINLTIVFIKALKINSVSTANFLKHRF